METKPKGKFLQKILPFANSIFSAVPVWLRAIWRAKQIAEYQDQSRTVRSEVYRLRATFPIREAWRIYYQIHRLERRKILEKQVKYQQWIKDNL